MPPLSDLIAIAWKTATVHGLFPEIVMGICEQESSWNSWAVRFESAFEARYIKPANPATPTTEEITRAMSFGLMQVMGENARECGFTGKFLSELCDPATGIEYGCRILDKKLALHNGDLTAGLLSYNGGSNTAYPQQVLAKANYYKNSHAGAPQQA